MHPTTAEFLLHMDDLRDRLSHVETILGRTADEGLRAEFASLKSDFRDLKSTIHKMELRLYTVYGAGLAIWYIMIHK